LDEKWYNLEFLQISLLECNLASPFLIIVIFVTVVFREKHGLVRNDFLDCMMELRRASKDEAQGDVQSEKNANTGVTFGKLQLSVTLGETGYYVKLSEKNYIYNIIHLIGINHNIKV